MDREAEFRRLYEAHRAAVHAYFTGRTGDPQSAADLMQDVFLRVWQHLEKLTGMPDDRQRAWIFTVARNLSVDAHRHQHTRAGVEQAVAREPPGRPSGPAPRSSPPNASRSWARRSGAFPSRSGSPSPWPPPAG